jgi:hypothetical protein
VPGGFYVDLDAMQQAAKGITDTLDELKQHDVSSISSSSSSYGHDRLGDTVADFCDRWQLGVANLTKDGQAIASKLGDSLKAYRKAELDAHEGLNRIFQSATGEDPAAK